MVKRWKISLLVICLIGIYTSCSTYDFVGMLAAGSSVQERFENSISLFDQNSHMEKIISDQDRYRFLIATDLHIQQEDWDKLGRFLSYAAKDENLLTVLLGDYMYVAGSSLQQLSDSIKAQENLRVFTAIGNHDVYKNGYQSAYRPTFGATCYYFKAQIASVHDLFIILDSANGTLGVDQFEWLQTTLSNERNSARNCYIFTHSNFFGPPSYIDVVSTYPIEEQMKLLNVFSKHHVTAVFTGHSHVRDQTTVRGVKYITVGCWRENKRKGEYCQVECDPQGNLSLDFKSVD